MFKDTKEGTTHYQNDGCGESAHNSMPLKQFLTTEREEFEKKFDEWFFGTDRSPKVSVEQEFVRVDAVKRWISSLISSHDSKLLTVLKEVVEGMSVEKYPDDGKKLKVHDFYLGYDQALEDIKKLFTAE